MRGFFPLVVVVAVAVCATASAQNQQQFWVASGGMWMLHNIPYADCDSAQNHANTQHLPPYGSETQLPCGHYSAMPGHFMICPVGYDPNSNAPPPLIVCPVPVRYNTLLLNGCPQPPVCQPCKPVCERPRLFPLFRRCR